MMPVLKQSDLDDVICVWLDEIIPLLEQHESLKWPHERDITLPEALRGALFHAVKRAVDRGTHPAPRRKTIKFPSSAIARVQNAISHLSQFTASDVAVRSVVFMPMSVTDLAHQVPVAHALAEIDRSYCFVFQRPGWSSQMDLSGVDVLQHSKALQSQLLCARLRARVMWLRLGREDHLALPKLKYAFKEFDLSDIVLEAIVDSVTAAFEGHALAKSVIYTVRPKLIALTNELHPNRRVIVAAAKRAGIRCVDLMAQVNDSPLDAYRLCDRYVVFGNYAKRVLCASGVDTKKIKTCGTPYLDALALHKPLKFLTKSQAEIASKSNFLLVDVDERFAAALLRMAGQTPGIFILYLTQKAGTLFQRYLKQTRNFRIFQKRDLSSGKYASCLKSADVFVTDNFKSALEAMSLGKKVVALDFEGGFDDREFLKASLVLVARDIQELLQVVSASEEKKLDESSKLFWEDYFSRKDGNASSRVASVIVEECQK